MSVTAHQSTPDPTSIIIDWLGHLYDNIDTGWLTLFSQNRTTGQRHTDWSPVDDYDAFAESALARAGDCCVWWGVATRHQHLPHGRGTAADCAHIPALWVDIDVAGPNHQTTQPLPPNLDAAHQLLADHPQPPTAIVATGGGLQAWWLLTEPATATDLQPLLERWGNTWVQLAERHSWHIDNVFDVARIMRLPGTHNRKNNPVPVELVAADWARTYGLDDLEQHLLEPPPVTHTPTEKVPYIGPARPGDAFNATHTGADILQAAGWTLGHQDRNGDQHWTRPGKNPRHGSSATVYADDGHTTIWSDAVPGIEVRRPYDPFGLYTHLLAGGDFTRATETLATQGYGTQPRSSDDLAWIPPQAANESPPDHYIDPELDEFLNTDDPDYDWLVEGLIERQDRIIITGEEGQGKSTLLRQIAVQLASGIHPFTCTQIEPLQVLYVDCENSARQVRRKLRDLRTPAGTNYIPGRLRLRILGHAIDLADPTIEADLATRIDSQAVDIIVIGPLYKLICDDPVKELPAKAVADAIDRLRQIRGSSVLIEAHSPYAEGNGKKRPTRPYGASLWSRWPEFGIHLGATGNLTHWRGQRDERHWPAVLARSIPWPWAPAETPDSEPRSWDGPTECAAAITAILTELGTELSTRKIGDELRARGSSYRDETVRAAARIAANNGQVIHRVGSRGADLYRPNTTGATDEMF